MLKTIFVQALVSLIIIMGSHYLYTYFKFNLTTPKIRDLVTKPNEEYKKIYSTIKESKQIPQNDTEKEEIKSKLKSFMKTLSSNSDNSIKIKEVKQEPQQEIQSYSGNANFSTFM